MKKILLSFLLIFTLVFPSSVVAIENINIDYSTDGETVTVSVEGEKNRPISIVIEDNTRRYYIDQGITDSNGKAEFITKLEKGKEYDCSVKLDKQEKKIKIIVKDTQDPPAEPDIAYIYIKGYKGVILSKTEVEIQDNDTVMSLTKRVLGVEEISYKVNSGYVSSIDGQEEKDKGSGSGWMCSVNGSFINTSADNVDVRDGSDIKWLYTYDLGKDLGYSFEEQDKIDKAKDILNDKNASEKDIINAIKDVTKYFNQNFGSVKTEKEIKSAVKNADRICDIFLKAAQNAQTDKVAKEVAENSINFIQSLSIILDNTNKEDVKENIDIIVQRSMGATLEIINKIQNKTSIDELIEKIIDTSVNIEDKLANYKSDNNKIREKKVSIQTINEKDNEIEFKLPCRFLEKSSQKRIDKIQIDLGMIKLNLKPNFINTKLGESNLKIEAKKLIDLKVPDNIKNKIGENIVLDLDITIDNKKISEFNEPIEVSIPYNGKTNNERAVSVFLLKDDGTIEPVGGYYDAKSKTVIFITNHFSKYFAKEAVKEFNDITNHWAREEISIMAGKGIINGREDDKFDPDDNIKRAEFAALITRMLKCNADINDTIPFNDVSNDKWYYKDVITAYNNGLINGKTLTEFDPEGNITRQEMAMIISNVLEKKLYKEGNIKELGKFNDESNIAQWAKKAVALTIREEIIKGVEEGKFAPTENATRAQSAVMLYRLYQLVLN